MDISTHNALRFFVSDYAHKDYLSIVNDTFFHTRPVSLIQCFPWVFKNENSTFYVLAKKDNTRVVGGITIKILEKENVKVGLIGLVCVDPKERGNGISGKLLNLAVAEARKRNLGILTLWTSKHYVYEKVGFELYDNSLLYQVKKRNLNEEFCCVKGEISEEKLDVLPPFALSGVSYFISESSLVVVDTQQGRAVASFSGSLDDVIMLIAAKLPETFLINAYKGDPLWEGLSAYLLQLNGGEVNLQMWKVIDKRIGKDVINQIKINVLDRI